MPFISPAVNQPKGTKNESNSQRHLAVPHGPVGCKSTQRYKERKQFTTSATSWSTATRCKSTQRYKERKQFTTQARQLLRPRAVNQPKGTKNESNSQQIFYNFRIWSAVNQPKGTKNESNSQRSLASALSRSAVNQPKGTKNESNSQPETCF